MMEDKNHKILKQFIENETNRQAKELKYSKEYANLLDGWDTGKGKKPRVSKESKSVEDKEPNPKEVEVTGLNFSSSKKKGKKEKINLSNRLSKKEKKKMKTKADKAIEDAEWTSWNNFQTTVHEKATGNLGIAMANFAIIEEAERLQKIDKNKDKGYEQMWIATKDENGAIKIIRNPRATGKYIKGTTDASIRAANAKMVDDLKARLGRLEQNGEYSDMAVANFNLWQNEVIAFGRKFIGLNKKNKPKYELEPSEVIGYDKKKKRPWTLLDEEETKRLKKKQKKAKSRLKKDRDIRNELSEDLSKNLSNSIEISKSLDKLDEEPFVRIIKAATSNIVEIRGKDHRGIERNITHHGNTKLLIEDFFKSQGYEVLERTEDEDAKEGTNISVAFVKDDHRHIIKIPIASNGATDLRMDKYFLEHPEIKQYMPRIVAEDYASNFSVHEKIYPIARYSEIILLELFRNEINSIFEHISKYVYLIDVSPDHTFNNMGLMRIDRDEYMEESDFAEIDSYLTLMKSRLYKALESNKSISVLQNAKKDEEWTEGSEVARVKHAIYKIYRTGKDKDIKRFGTLINEIVNEEEMQALKSKIADKYRFGFVDLSMCIPIDKNNKFVHYDENGFGLKCDQLVRKLNSEGKLKGKIQACEGSFRYVKKPFSTLNALTKDCKYGSRDEVEFDSSMMCTWHVELVCDCCGATKDITNGIINDPRNYYRLLDNSLGLKDYENIENILGEGCIQTGNGSKTTIAIESSLLENMQDPEIKNKLQRIREIFDISIQTNHELAEEVAERMKANGFEGVIYLSPSTMNNIVYLVPELGNKDGKMKLMNVSLYFNEGEGLTNSVTVPKNSNVFKVFKYIFKHIMKEKPSNIYKISPNSYHYYKSVLTPTKKNKFAGSEHFRIQTLIDAFEGSRSDFLCDYTDLDDAFEDLYKAYRIPPLLKFNDINYQYMGDMKAELSLKDDTAFIADDYAGTEDEVTNIEFDRDQATWVITYGLDEEEEISVDIKVVSRTHEVIEDLNSYDGGIGLAEGMHLQREANKLNPKCEYCYSPLDKCICNKIYVIETAKIGMSIADLKEAIISASPICFIGVIDNMSDYGYETSMKDFKDREFIEELLHGVINREEEEEETTIKLNFSAKGKESLERYAAREESEDEEELIVCDTCRHVECQCVCHECQELLDECTCGDKDETICEDCGHSPCICNEDDELEDGEDICEYCLNPIDECDCEEDDSLEDEEDVPLQTCEDCGLEFQDCVCDNICDTCNEPKSECLCDQNEIVEAILGKHIDQSPSTTQVINLLTNVQALVECKNSDLTISEDFAIAHDINRILNDSGVKKRLEPKVFEDAVDQSIDIVKTIFSTYTPYFEDVDTLHSLYEDLKNENIIMDEEVYTSSDLLHVTNSLIVRTIRILNSFVDKDVVLDDGDNNFSERKELDLILKDMRVKLLEDLLNGDERDISLLEEAEEQSLQGSNYLFKIMARTLFRRIIANSMDMIYPPIFKNEAILQTFKEDSVAENIVTPYYCLYDMIVNDRLNVTPELARETYITLLVDEYFTDEVINEEIFSMSNIQNVNQIVLEGVGIEGDEYDGKDMTLYQAMLDYLLSFVEPTKIDWFKDTIIRYPSYISAELKLIYAHDVQSEEVGFIDVDFDKNLLVLKK